MEHPLETQAGQTAHISVRPLGVTASYHYYKKKKIHSGMAQLLYYTVRKLGHTAE